MEKMKQKWGGTCIICKEKYLPKEEIFWASGKGGAHLKCYQSILDEQEKEKKEKWETSILKSYARPPSGRRGGIGGII